MQSNAPAIIASSDPAPRRSRRQPHAAGHPSPLLTLPPNPSCVLREIAERPPVSWRKKLALARSHVEVHVGLDEARRCRWLLDGHERVLAIRPRRVGRGRSSLAAARLA
jgi:hypothetical protein